MIPDMIALASKDTQIVQAVVILVAILMMYNMVCLQVKYLRYALSGYLATIAPCNVWFTVTSLQKSVITFSAAKHMCAVPYLTFRAQMLFTAHVTGYRQAVFGRVHPIAFEDFIDALSGNPILFGQVNHGC